MYTKFFGFNEKPFTITPDPRYLFLSERHNEGLAHLVYGIKDSSGFIQLTGEVGTGKTTLVRTLLTRVPEDTEVALILNPQLGPLEFLAAICDELNIDLPDDALGSKALVGALNEHLLAAHADGRRTILVIDEAQNLSTEVLEEVRLLTNLETARQKLLQIILIAQPELREKLAQQNLRQLAQRVTGRYHLEPLSSRETSAYIDHRIRVAGGLGEVFDAGARREVYRQSRGVPRLINVICDRALLGAYGLETRRVTRSIVRQAAREVSGRGRRVRRWLAPLAGVTAALAIVGLVYFLPAETRTASTVTATAALPAAEQVAPEESEPPAPPPEDTTSIAPPAPTVTARQSLDDILAASAGVTTEEQALGTLLSVWGLGYDASRGNACAQAQSGGLSCLRQRGSWKVLEQLNRPAVLTLADTSGALHSAALISIQGNDAALVIGDREFQVPVIDVWRRWSGQFALLWRPPGGDPSILRRGVQGPKVVWLRQSLAELDPDAYPEPGSSDVFDVELEQYVKEFQRRNLLQTDGLAGQQTQILINSQLGLDGRPRLQTSEAG